MAQQQKKPIGENGLRVVSLIGENVKKLVAVEIHPDGRLVKITGDNAQGKSSVLDCIWLACDRASNPQEKIIRRGQQQARIELNLGEIIVERKFTDKGTTLTVTSADGAQYKSPQTMLDDFFGSLSFDPLGFTRMDEKKQAAELRRIAQVDVDIELLEGQIKSAFDKRTEVSRNARNRRAAAEAIAVPEKLPEQPLDEKALLDQIQQAGEHNAQIETRKARRTEAERDVREHRSEAQRARETKERERVELEAKLAALIQYDRIAEDEENKAKELEQKLAEAGDLPEPIDVATLRVSLDDAQAVNADIARRENRAVIVADAEALEAEAQAFTETIDAKRKTINDAIAAAKMPVPGLGFADGTVTYNEIPFNQASAAEQLTISFAIAKATNPKLRVVLIKDASLLAPKSIEHLAEMAKEGDYQIWLEQVDVSGKVGFFIEDGNLVAVDGKPVEPAAGAEKQGSLV